MQSTNYWLMKSEPDCFSIQDLAKCPKKTTFWDGVRNYQARNYMRSMQKGDHVLFYHSGANPPAIAGTATVVRTAYPDHTALDPAQQHYDPKSTTENPIWEMVDIRLESVFERPLGLDELRKVPALAKMELLKKGSRLSVQPVTEKEWNTVLQLAAEGTTAPKTKDAVKKSTLKKSILKSTLKATAASKRK
ncbi:MAG: EVE domain-containing protein [Planctomycetota bacterium]|nr:EVE domain-containing protein [Planctomycetota bacterium]